MLTLAGHAAAVRCVAYSPDGALLASGGDDGVVRVWDLASRLAVWASEKEGDPGIEALAFSADSTFILGGWSNGMYFGVAMDRWKQGWLHAAHNAAVRAILPHPDGVRIFTAGWDRDIWVWRLNKPKRIQLCKLPKPTASAALSPDGRTLALGLWNSGIVCLIDTDSGKVGKSRLVGESEVFSLAFTSDGSLLAAGDTRGRINLWNPAQPNQPPRALDGHSLPVYGLAFTPDGRRLVSAGADKTARVWDVATGRTLHEFLWHQSWVTCLAMAPDGLTVATGGEDKVVSVWDVPE